MRFRSILDGFAAGKDATAIRNAKEALHASPAAVPDVDCSAVPVQGDKRVSPGAASAAERNAEEPLARERLLRTPFSWARHHVPGEFFLPRFGKRPLRRGAVPKDPAKWILAVLIGLAVLSLCLAAWFWLEILRLSV
jgi:hypothetical protein